jgi:hypothetical protein
LGLKVASHNDALIQCKLSIPKMPWLICFPSNNLFHLVIEENNNNNNTLHNHPLWEFLFFDWLSSPN